MPQYQMLEYKFNSLHHRVTGAGIRTLFRHTRRSTRQAPEIKTSERLKAIKG